MLVLEPGTSAGSAYFVPLAKWIVAKTHGWQVWSVERRENLVEDQSELNLAKQGKVGGSALFNYYLGYLDEPVDHEALIIPDAAPFSFAKGWGMNVAVQDLHRVIAAARKLGGKVVLGGHSLGGSVVAAYATWNFGGQPGARDLAGLVFIDGSSFRTETAAQARNGAARPQRAEGHAVAHVRRHPLAVRRPVRHDRVRGRAHRSRTARRPARRSRSCRMG